MKFLTMAEASTGVPTTMLKGITMLLWSACIRQEDGI